MKRVVVLGVTLLLVVTAQAGLYRWVDDAGNVHFSDKVPAAASKKSHSKLSKTGGVAKKVEPESKQSEIEHLKQAKREQEKLDEINRIKAEAYAVIQKRDDNLLSTYENENELMHYYESKIKMIEGNTKILQAQNTVLNRKVGKLEDKASKTDHEETVKSIASKIVNINHTIDQYKQALNENEKQIATLSETYKEDLSRYKELTNK